MYCKGGECDMLMHNGNNPASFLLGFVIGVRSIGQPVTTKAYQIWYVQKKYLSSYLS